MTEQIAASVAKALGLHEGRHLIGEEAGSLSGWFDDHEELDVNGSNLFNPYWQVRCRDWLLEFCAKKIDDSNMPMHAGLFFSNSFENAIKSSWGGSSYVFECPASEFCARAIHDLMKNELTSSKDVAK